MTHINGPAAHSVSFCLLARVSRQLPARCACYVLMTATDPDQGVVVAAFRPLLRAGVVMICAGGGGIPVAREGAGYRGMEAVIDKDLASALLAIELKAAALLLTDVEGVYRHWGTDKAAIIGRAAPLKCATSTFAA